MSREKKKTKEGGGRKIVMDEKKGENERGWWEKDSYG